MVAVTAMSGSLAAMQPMNKLNVLVPVTLGDAAADSGAVCAADIGSGHAAIVWLNQAGQIVSSTSAANMSAWSRPALLLGDASLSGFSMVTLRGDARSGWRLSATRNGGTVASEWTTGVWTDAWQSSPAPTAQAPAAGKVDGVFGSTNSSAGNLVLRPGRRVVGTKPTFPGAGLVVSRSLDGKLHDVAFADEIPDVKVAGAAVAVVGGRMVGAYLVQDASGKSVCRVMQMPADSKAAASSAWTKRPDFPQAPGMAGPMTGEQDGVLISAGGTDWPKPGKKMWHDTIYALVPGEEEWRPAGKLRGPRAYGATVSVPGGALVMGGDRGNSPEELCQDVLLMKWDGEQVQISPMPDLPKALTNSMAVLHDRVVYFAGGAGGSPRLSSGEFWSLNLDEPESGWRPLPTWPGPARSHAVMAALDGMIYLLSGLDTHIGADGKAESVYLSDAYRFHPGKQTWEKLPDLPWSAIAAPSPAPVTTSPARVFVLGGVDGRQAGKLPADTRVPEDVIYFDVSAHQWKLWPQRWPASAVTIPAVGSGTDWNFVSGEIMGGVRTTEVWSWHIEENSP